MEKYMDDFQNYKRFTSKCTCKCDAHCGQSCQDCEYCADCQCEDCKKLDESRGN